MANDSDELAELRAAVKDLSARMARLEQGAPPVVTVAAGNPKKLEARLGLTVINRVGAVTLAIGILFFLKYAVDLEWVGARARVALAVAGGLLLIGAADWLRAREQPVFAQGLCGCGAAVIYATAYAAFAYYHLISIPPAFVALVLTAGFAVLLSFRYQSPALASLGFAGAFLVPLLASSDPPTLWASFIYFALAAAGAILLANRQQWLMLLLSAVPEALLAAYIHMHGQNSTLVAGFDLTLSAVLFLGNAKKASGKTYGKTVYVLAHACLLFCLFRVLQIWSDVSFAPSERSSFLGASASILLALYAVALIVWGSRRDSGVNRVLGLALVGLVVAKLYLYDVWLLNKFYRIPAFCVLGALLLGASYVYSRSRVK